MNNRMTLALAAAATLWGGGVCAVRSQTKTVIATVAAGKSQMVFEKDVPIPVSDGNVLRADVFRPVKAGKYPVILAQTAYGKDIPLKTFAPDAYAGILKVAPGLCSFGTTSCTFLRWEVADPEHWVPLGYVVIHLDARGTGKSPGYFDPWSARQTQDYYDAIEWAARQDWSSGKVGLLGTSFMAMNQWQVAALRPPHLTAIIPWQGSTDVYRDFLRNGGIASNFFTGKIWYPNVIKNQNGNGDSPNRDPFTHERTTGEAKDPVYLAGSRVPPLLDTVLDHPLDDEWYRERTPHLDRIEVPMLVGANWVGVGLHEAGTFRGYVSSGSKQNWLVAHSAITDTFSLYTPKYVAMQERFFAHFLQGANNGWEKTLPVLHEARRPDGTEVDVTATAWPLPSIKWTKRWLDAGTKTLVEAEPAVASTVSYRGLGDGITLTSAPLESPLELIGPLTAKLWVSSTTTDLDLFLAVRAFAPDGKEVTFERGDEPHVPLAQGWMRASLRAKDTARSTEATPVFRYDEIEPLTPGTLYPVEVEIWPTSVRLPAGYRLALTIQGEDFHRDGNREPGHGSGNLLHNDPRDRPSAIFDGTSTISTGGEHASYLLLPVIPKR